MTTDTLSLRARRALAALRVKKPEDMSALQVSRAQLLELPNCGPGTIREIAAWGGEHGRHLLPNTDAPHRAPTSPTSADDRRAAPIVKVCPPSVEERERWRKLAESRGVSLSRLASDLLSRECDGQTKGGV